MRYWPARPNKGSSSYRGNDAERQLPPLALIVHQIIDPPPSPSDDGAMSRLQRPVLILLLLLGSLQVHAWPGDAPPNQTVASMPAQSLDQLGDQLDAIQATLKDKRTKIPLGDLRNTALKVQDYARQLAASLAPQMGALQAQLGVLGPPPAAGAPPEAGEVASQRRKLNKASADIDAQIKQAQLLDQDAMRLATQITGLRNDQLQARLAERTVTPFSAVFWRDPTKAFPDDLRRLQRLGSRSLDAWKQAWQPANRTPLLLCLFGAVLLLAIGRWLLERWLLGLAQRRVPGGHLRRSAMALAVAVTAVLTTGLAAQLIYLGVNWHDILDADLDAMAGSLVNRILFAAYMAGLGRALLSVKRPSWRLPALSDREARRLRPFPWLLATSALLLGVFERVNRGIGASLPATVASRALLTLLIASLIGAALLRLHGARRKMRAAGEPPSPRPLWLGLLTAAAALGVIVSWLAVATGYISLGFFVARQMLWVGVIVLTLYLLVLLLQDLFDTLLSPEGASGKRLQSAFELHPNALDQAIVVLSGISRLALMLLALVAVLAPFGAGPADLFASASRTFSSIKLGELPIDPGSIFTGIMVFVIGWFALRTLKRWLNQKLLPKTAMAPGMRDSVITLLGYLGGIVVFVLTLAALHVDLKSITWIVSALSVGIGFGLQAIVQNFISGLILLAERPIKVGDWISIGTVEGDVRRINVRATEILQWDRSTVIVPNSQLITENVRNVTTTNALGRVNFKLPMPLDTDAARARDIILDVLTAHSSTLDNPAPFVRLDSIDAAAIVISAYAYTANPREAPGVKSDLQFSVLQRLREESLRLIRPQDMRMHRAAPATSNNPDQAVHLG